MGEEKAVSEGEELPKAIVRRVVKDRLRQLSSGDTSSDFSVFKDALQAFSESTRIFIHYLSATANDICKESKRQTINADDVFKALEEIEFSEFIGPLKASLEEFKKKNAGKKNASKEKETNKKQKIETPIEHGDEEAEEVEVDDDDNTNDGSDNVMDEDVNGNINIENGDGEDTPDGDL